MSDAKPLYTLVGHPRSRAMRVIWMLEEVGATYAIEPATAHSDAARAANPEGKIPALVTPEGALTDSVAMMQFLADRHGAMTFPAGTIERARQDAHLLFALDEIEGALWVATKHARILPEAMRAPLAIEAARSEFDKALGALAARLGDGPFLMGETCTVPDILIGHCAGWAAAMNWPLPEGKVSDYVARLRARPAFARASARAAEAIAAAA